MAAGLAFARATVDTPDRQFTGVGIVTRNNVARLYQGQTVVAEMAGVTAVVQVDRRQWRVEGPDVVWLVTRARGG